VCEVAFENCLSVFGGVWCCCGAAQFNDGNDVNDMNDGKRVNDMNDGKRFCFIFFVKHKTTSVVCC
jgi:hypothetical protein